MADGRKPKEQQGLPEGWEWVRLEEILKFLKGKTPRKLYDYEDEGMTIYLTPEYLRKNKCDVAFCKKEETLLANEDIIILWDGSNAGEVFWAEKGAVASTMAKIDINSSDYPIYKKFLYYHLKSNEFAFKYQVKGSGIPHFEKDILNTLNSIFPPLPEQRKIAQILETVDNAIEKTEKIIEKYKRIKQGLMQDLLTKGIDEKGNIRSEKTHKFKDSSLGRIPEEWEVVRLGEISKTITKGTTPTTYGFSYTNDGINFIKIESIDENGKFIIEKFEHIDKKTNEYLSRSKLEEGDILFSIAGALGRVAIVEKSILPANTNQALAIIRLKEKKEATIKFLRFYLAGFSIQNYIENILVRSAQSNLTLEQVSNFLIPLPPLSEQKRIAEILSQIDQAIEKEEKYKQKLERLKKGLMEDLLTGKVRVNKLLEGENHEMA
jgi:type I restriction enzyme S subunit